MLIYEVLYLFYCLYFLFVIKDRKADLVIHTYVDDLMKSLMDILGVDIEKYEKTEDPIVSNKKNADWTIYETDVIRMQNMIKTKKKFKKLKTNHK